MKRVAVIGAGLGGLSAALRLSHSGHAVDVYEKLDGPGGKARELSKGGYRFDMGPSLLTLPQVFRQLFNEVEEVLEEHLEFIRLDPITRYFFDDGTVLDAYSEEERFAGEVEEKLGERSETVLRYLSRCRKIYEATTPIFMFKPLHETSTLLSSDVPRAFIGTPILDVFRTMHEVNRRWFRDPRTVQLFDRYATYNGSSPYAAPALFNLIQHTEYGMGGYCVKGGIHRIPSVMEKLARGRGAVFHYGSEVQRINIGSGRVEGIRLDDGDLKYDAVISNCDVSNTYNELLRDSTSSKDRKNRKLEPSSSGQVFLWGIGADHRELMCNNIFFSQDYEKEFKEIWQGRTSPSDPTVYINITSRADPFDAPSGSENWFVLVNVPYDSGQNWRLESERTRDRIMKRLTPVLGDIEGSIEVEERMGPREIEELYNGNRGSIYGFSSNSRRSAFLRQSNRSRDHRGLFFAGGSAHPGGGMPLVVLSGKHAADLASKYLGRIS
ncbi:MAG: phytoene desaturase family protein [Thermoplasmatota archaeon]